MFKKAKMSIVFILLQLALMRQGDAAKPLYKRVQMHDSQVALLDTAHDFSFFKCSVMCSENPTDCKLFFWNNGICRHGLPALNQDTSGSLINVYLRSDEKGAMDLLNKKDLAIFEDRQWVFKGKLYWKSKVRRNFEESKKECSKYGGTLPVLNDKEAFQFLLTNNVILLTEEPYLGLETNPDTTLKCGLDDCNGKMTWANGEPFVYQKHLPCTDLNEPVRHYAFHIHYWTRVSPYCVSDDPELADLSAGHWRLTDQKETRLVNFICQFEL